jgi:hypothetical protein
MVSSAQDKVIIPKNGIISFKMQEIITDTLAYRASNKKMIKDMFSSHGKSLKDEMETKDTLQLRQTIEELSTSTDFLAEMIFNPAQSSSIFKTAWNASISELYTYLNATYTITSPSYEELKRLLVYFLNINIGILQSGATISINPGIGNIPTSPAVYCP